MSNTQEFKMYFQTVLNSFFNDDEVLDLCREKGDACDQVASEKDTALKLKLKERRGQYVKQVEAALNKIDRGEFGTCGECEGSIETARLKACPTASLCVECQEDQERGHVAVGPASRFTYKNISSINSGEKNEKASYEQASEMLRVA